MTTTRHPVERMMNVGEKRDRLTPFAITFTINGTARHTWVRYARDKYDARDSAAEAIEREWPTARSFEISDVQPFDPRTRR